MDHDAAAAAAIAALTEAYPHLAQGPASHPALAGCEEVDWTVIPGCPKGVPVVLRGLVDPRAAEEASRALSWLVMSGPLRISTVMPAVVPFLLRLAADPSVPLRGELFDLVLMAAALSEPADPGSPWDLAISGPEEDHPERALCRASFAADAAWVRRLLADEGLPVDSPLSDDERARLLGAAGL
ncbi:hypothetical protein ACFVFI_30160 [Streptomyces sp. NPDC057705]|uniref:hypothetical protein n=1 Tax=Streptomyces sp. NPDC057705 TaxID=3346222 RepID=UPI00369A26BC